MTILQAFRSAVLHHQAGRLAEAERGYRRILAQQPDHADAMHLLGVIAHQAGRHEIAVDLIGRAVRMKPAFADALTNLGAALMQCGQLDEAIAAFEQAVVFKPSSPEIHNNLGNALTTKGRLDEAITACRQAIALKAEFPEAHYNLGNALAAKGQFGEAVVAFRRAIALKPNFPEAFNNLGGALRDDGATEEAIAAFRQTIALKPDYVEAYSNLGNGVRDNGLFEEASAAFRPALSLRPDLPEAHRNLALTLLLQGDFRQGWKENEWRWQCEHFPSPRWSYSQPQWDGTDLTGKTILLHAEQGFGDTIQFVRYVPMVAQRGANVILVCPPQLKRLLQTVPGVARLLTRGDTLPSFDVHCPLLSLPLAFGTTPQTIPDSVPYLHADAGRIEQWRKRLEFHPHPFSPTSRHPTNVGLAWAGTSKHKNDRNRSMRLSLLAPLSEVQGVTFFSLQTGEPAGQANDPPAGMNLTDWTEDLHDFADTAGLIAHLDLVISVDTAVAHLVGAMGKPVWTLLPFAPDWRWLQNRPDSPWYPTMRLFRQKSRGDWSSVIRDVTEAIAQRKAVAREKD